MCACVNRRSVLEQHRSHGLDYMGPIKPSLAICVFSVFVLVYFSLWKGVRSAGKVVWVTALAPYVVLFFLLIRGVTLPGAGEGIRYYLTPQWHKLKNSRVCCPRSENIVCASESDWIGIHHNRRIGLDRCRIANILFAWAWIRYAVGIVQLQ